MINLFTDAMKNRIYLKKLEDLFSDWKETVPEKLHKEFLQDVFSLSEEVIADFFEKFEKTGSDWGFWPESVFVSELLSKTIRRISTPTLEGFEHVEQALEKLKSGEISKLMIVTNHFSYSDANIVATYLQPVFQKYGFEHNLSVVVGPKVFNNKFKKFSSMHFNSLLIAQSLSVATKEASMSPREVAKAAIKVANDIKEHVKILLVFPEGGRSRDGCLKRFLPGVLRILDVDNRVAILPGAVFGGEILLPINSGKLHYCDVTLKTGAHFMLTDIKNMFAESTCQKHDVMDFIGKKVGELMPSEQRGVYGADGE